MMTSAQVVETSVNVTSNSPSQDYTHPDDHNLPNYDMTPGFKPFTHLIFVNETLLSLVYTEPDVDCPVEIPLPGRTNEN